jgi:chromate reductase, NAD(P)H dehydrogenase (quinone)
MNFLAISGSLRAASLNSAFLRATVRLAPPGTSVQLFQGLGDLPLFNPDIEETEPLPVATLRSRIIAADALIIASPEYAHGITGVLKNALDWLVSSEVFVNKPVALFNASPLSVHAHASLREVVTVMSARVVDESSIVLPVRGSRLDEDGIYDEPTMSALIRESLLALAHAVAVFRSEQQDTA